MGDGRDLASSQFALSLLPSQFIFPLHLDSHLHFPLHMLILLLKLMQMQHTTLQSYRINNRKVSHRKKLES